MIILGIDPGLSKLAFSIINAKNKNNYIKALGIIKNIPKINKLKKINYIYQMINLIIEIYKPNLIIYEEIFIYKNLKSIIDIAKIQGILISLSIKHKIPIEEVNPTYIKKNIYKGNADKETIKKNIIKLFKIFFNKIDIGIENILEFDIYDSLSIILAYMQKNNYYFK
jgi:crossover junction endodeoxyribonuclease RuvC